MRLSETADGSGSGYSRGVSAFFPKPRPRKPRPKVFDGDGPNGSVTWFLGFVALLLPVVGAFLAGPVMMIHARREAVHNEFSREHARRAANWGLTYSALTVAMFAVHFGGLWIASRQGVVVRGMGGPFGVLLIGWFLLSGLHLGICAVGGMRARRGEEFAWKAAIPFFT